MGKRNSIRSKQRAVRRCNKTEARVERCVLAVKLAESKVQVKTLSKDWDAHLAAAKGLREENEKLRAALELLLGWHDEVCKQMIVVSPFGIDKAREALGVI